MIDKALYIVVPDTVLVGKGRTFETIHRIGKEGSETESLVRVVNSPGSERHLMMLYLIIIVLMNLRDIRKYLFDMGHGIEGCLPRLIFINTYVVTRFHPVGILSFPGNQENRHLLVCPATYFETVVTLQAVEPDLFCLFPAVFPVEHPLPGLLVVHLYEQTVRVMAVDHETV